MFRHAFLAVVMVVTASAQVSSACIDCVVEYDASEGTLPSEQGWNLIGSASPAPTVSGGSLHQGLTSFSGLQYWDRTDGSIDLTTGFAAEVRLRVVSSTYGAGGLAGTWRTGWQLLVNDNQGRVNILGISDTGVRIANEPNSFNSLSSPFIAFDTTDDFHTYKLTSTPNGLSLMVDGNTVASLPLGSTGLVTPNYIWFGDGTTGGSSETYIRSLVIGAVIPEPSSNVLLASAVAYLPLMRYRRLR